MATTSQRLDWETAGRKASAWVGNTIAKRRKTVLNKEAAARNRQTAERDVQRRRIEKRSAEADQVVMEGINSKAQSIVVDAMYKLATLREDNKEPKDSDWKSDFKDRLESLKDELEKAKIKSEVNKEQMKMNMIVTEVKILKLTKIEETLVAEKEQELQAVTASWKALAGAEAAAKAGGGGAAKQQGAMTVQASGGGEKRRKRKRTHKNKKRKYTKKRKTSKKRKHTKKRKTSKKRTKRC